jgi:hypothetical protein
MNTLSKFILGLFFLTVFSQQGYSQTPEPLKVVQDQLDAYNRQDITAFVNTFASNALIYRTIGDTVPMMKGHQEIEKQYSEMFKKYPENKSTLKGRMIQGNVVIDHEWITGRDKEVSLIAIYEVIDGKISRCWFIR